MSSSMISVVRWCSRWRAKADRWSMERGPMVVRCDVAPHCSFQMPNAQRQMQNAECTNGSAVGREALKFVAWSGTGTCMPRDALNPLMTRSLALVWDSAEAASSICLWNFLVAPVGRGSVVAPRRLPKARQRGVQVCVGRTVSFGVLC